MLSLQTGRVTGWRGDRNHHPLISPDYRPSVWPCGFAGPMSDAAAVQITTEHAECGGCPAWRISQSVHEVAELMMVAVRRTNPAAQALGAGGRS